MRTEITAEVRAEWRADAQVRAQWDANGNEPWDIVLALLDALEAAERARDEHYKARNLMTMAGDEWREKCLNARMEREKASEALAEATARAERAEAALDRVEALAAKWEAWRTFGSGGRRACDLRAALADPEPRDEGEAE